MRPIILATLIALSLFLPKESAAQNWQWAKPADHQTAACIVQSEGGSRGSGALIEVNGKRFVLTCKHVVDGMRGYAKFRDGTKLAGKWLSPDSSKPDGRYDMACLVFDEEPPMHLIALKVAERDPGPGSRVEIMGFGGSKALFRPYYGKLVDTNEGGEHQTIDAPVVHGDSGSVCVDENGDVIGVQNVGQGDGFAGQTEDGTGYYRTCGICPIAPIRNFIRRVAARVQCGPSGGGCSPAPQPNFGGQAGRGQLYPPQDQYPSRPQGPVGPQAPPSGQAQAPSPPKEYEAPKPTPAPPETVPPVVDYSKLADALIKHPDASKLQGPAGPAGKDGKDGLAGAPGIAGKDAAPLDPKLIAAEVSKSLPIDEIAKKAASMIDLDLIASKVVVQAPAQNNQPTIHAVLVADQTQGYWTALKPQVDLAKSQHSGIRVVPEPDMEVGLLPRLVIYRDGVVVKQYGGYAQVVSGLHAFSQGVSL